VRLGPLRAVAHAPLCPRERLLDHHPEHDGCGETQRVPVYVSKRSLRHETMREGGGPDGPCEDILRMVIPQIDRRRPPNRHALRLALVVREQIRYFSHS
jgi:hypothetical protein